MKMEQVARGVRGDVRPFNVNHDTPRPLSILRNCIVIHCVYDPSRLGDGIDVLRVSRRVVVAGFVRCLKGYGPSSASSWDESAPRLYSNWRYLGESMLPSNST